MDYQAIIDNLQIDRVISIMKQLGINNYIEKDNYIQFPTICHNCDAHEASSKLYFYKDTKLFVCYTNCGTMSIFNFLKHYYETRQIEYDWYKNIYCLIVGNSNPADGFNEKRPELLRDKFSNLRKEKILSEYPKEVLDCFIKYAPIEWLNDGISVEALEKYNILFSISQNKIVIPHYDIDGRLVGIRGRALNPEEVEIVGKYAPIWIGGTCFKHPLSLNLYGLKENYKNIKEQRVCYLVESEKAVLQAESFSFKNCCVAVCGSNFNKYQLNLLLKHCAPQEIVICFDNEELPGQSKYFDKLWNIGKKYQNYCNFSFVYDMKGLTKLKDSPTDNGEEIFNKLVQERIIIK